MANEATFQVRMQSDDEKCAVAVSCATIEGDALTVCVVEGPDMGFLLSANTPLISRELVRPFRLVSLGIGLAILIAGSIWTPSDDWDIPLCFVMGIPSYVLAPWAFRQVCYFRWKWMPLAGLAFWGVIDGVYTLYWTLMGFDALASYRPTNFFYCLWLFWISGFVWNIDLSKPLSLFPRRLDEIGGRLEQRMRFAFRMIPTIFLIAFLSWSVGMICGFIKTHVIHNESDWMPMDIRVEMNLPELSK